MDQFARRIIGFGVHAGDVVGVALCRMFNAPISVQSIPHYVSSDNDSLFQYRQWLANLRILDFAELKSIPYTPISHPFVERLIGTIRRKYLDRVFVWNTQDLERKLVTFIQYYNHRRVHQSLGVHLRNSAPGISDQDGIGVAFEQLHVLFLRQLLKRFQVVHVASGVSKCQQSDQ
jgi:transposase InsO family protein